MKVLVTGGGGYIGTVLVRLLSKMHHSVRVLDRFSWGTQALASVLPEADVIAGSVTDPQTVEHAMRGMDAVVHLAAVVGYPACDANPTDAEQTNVAGTRLVCELSGTRRLIFASTGSTYGKVTGICTEQTPISPLTLYGRTKADGEALVRAAGGISLRFATLYGLSPRMRWDLLPHTFAQDGLRGEIRVFEGHVRRTFLHVEDAARAIAWVLETPADPVCNVGDEAFNLTKLDIARAVQSLTQCQIRNGDGHDPDARDYAVSYAAIRKTGWQPLYHFDLRPIVDWARVWC